MELCQPTKLTSCQIASLNLIRVSTMDHSIFATTLSSGGAFSSECMAWCTISISSTDHRCQHGAPTKQNGEPSLRGPVSSHVSRRDEVAAWSSRNTVLSTTSTADGSWRKLDLTSPCTAITQSSNCCADVIGNHVAVLSNKTAVVR